MEARLFTKDGEKVHTTRVDGRGPPWVMFEIPDITPRSLVMERPVSPPRIHLMRFRRVGVEVDMTGKWVRYEQDGPD